MRDEATQVAERPGSDRRPLLTFTSGGWVLVLAGLIGAALLAWGLAPAVLRMATRPAGDGRTIESYGFDLGDLEVPRHLIVAAMRHRDMVPTLDEPIVLSGHDLGSANQGRGKYIVSSDRVVGVEIGGEARAYPISVLTVHEIVHDTLGGRPIAVTYHWPCDSVAVFERDVAGRLLSFGVSGLLFNSNMLMYDRASAGGAAGGESLWSQMRGAAISGPAVRARLSLRMIPAELTSWQNWRARHPETTVIARDPALPERRYTKGDPESYFRARRIAYPVEPLPPANGPDPFDRVVAVEAGGAQRVYPLPFIEDQAGESGEWNDRLGDAELVLSYSRTSQTVRVTAADPDVPLQVGYALWFAWHAFHPDWPLADSTAAPHSGQRSDASL